MNVTIKSDIPEGVMVLQDTSMRKEIRLCDDIYTRSAEIARKLEIIHKDEAKHRREELQHGYLP